MISHLPFNFWNTSGYLFSICLKTFVSILLLLARQLAYVALELVQHSGLVANRTGNSSLPWAHSKIYESIESYVYVCVRLTKVFRQFSKPQKKKKKKKKNMFKKTFLLILKS